jgi:hypothetical protein
MTKTRHVSSGTSTQPVTIVNNGSFSRLTAEQQQQVDELIYGNAILQGILLLKRGLGIGLADSNLLFSWRYHKLRESHPRKFSRSDSDYWDGFYS